MTPAVHAPAPATGAAPSLAIRWHVERTGAGPTILAIHGTGSSGASFGRIAERLGGAFEVVAPDLPGHAATACPASFDPTLEAIAGALGGLVDELGLRPWAVVGHSAGAALLARMVLDGVVRPRVLVGLGAALTPLRGATRAVFPASARCLDRPAGARFAAAFAGRRTRELLESTGSHLDDDGVDRYRRLASDPRHVAGVLAMLARWDLRPTHARFPEIGIPVRLLVGSLDRAAPPAAQRRAAASLPDATVEILPGLGHLLHEEAPTRVAAALWDAVRDLAPDRTASVDLD